MARFIDYRAENQVEEVMLDYKTEIRREMAEHREDNHMQIEHHFREYHHMNWMSNRQAYYPYNGLKDLDSKYLDSHLVKPKA